MNQKSGVFFRIYKPLPPSPAPSMTMDEIPPEEAEELEVMAELQELMGPGTEASTVARSGRGNFWLHTDTCNLVPNNTCILSPALLELYVKR